MAQRVTQYVQESVLTTTTVKSRVTQFIQESVLQPNTTAVRVSQLAAEVIVSGVTSVTPPPGPTGGYFLSKLESGLAGYSHGGSNEMLISLRTGVTIPSDNVWYSSIIVSALVPCIFGQYIAYGGFIRWDQQALLPTPGVQAIQRIGLQFFDTNLALISEHYAEHGWGTVQGMAGFTNLVNGYAKLYSATYNTQGLSTPNPAPVPQGAAYVRMELSGYINNNSGTPFATGSTLYMDLRFDDLYMLSLVDPTNGILNRGSIMPTLNGSIAYASTTTTITWTWTGLAIFRSDQTTTPIPNGTVTITGLTAGTTYAFFPYWDEDLQAVTWVTGGVGTPGYANKYSGTTTTFFNQAQQQILVSHVPLSQGLMLASTTSSGSGGGTGGGGGRVCLRYGMLVEHRERGTVALGACEVGDEIWGRTGWTTIVRLSRLPNRTWVRTTLQNGSQIETTPTHPFTVPTDDGEEGKRAADLNLSDMLYVRKGVSPIKSVEVFEADDVKISITCDPDHEFFAGLESPDVLTHNIAAQS